MCKNNSDLGYFVTSEILRQKGRFTEEDIVDAIKDSVNKLLKTIEEIKNYVLYKLNQISEMGLIGRTDFYYYSLC